MYSASFLITNQQNKTKRKKNTRDLYSLKLYADLLIYSKRKKNLKITKKKFLNIIY